MLDYKGSTIAKCKRSYTMPDYAARKKKIDELAERA
jgi:hypothetical protein